MRKIQFLFVTVLSAAASFIVAADGNDLFEAKTATAGIEAGARAFLPGANRLQRQATRAAVQANRLALRAYQRCPTRPSRATHSLKKTAARLKRFNRALERADVAGDPVAGLAAFAQTTTAKVDALLGDQTVCDTGTTLTQEDDIDYVIDPAPFVDFGPGWGTLFSSAHGTFGDFLPDSTAPDHIHSSTYYGVVISGIIKNPFGASPGVTVPDAKPLPAGSFWSVPANAIHTTACAAGPTTHCLFYFHSRSAFDFDVDISGGDPDADAAREISAAEITTALARPDAVVSPFARMVTLWGDRSVGAHGTIGEFIPGGTSPAHVHSISYHGVVLSGTLVNPFLGEPIEEARELRAGDYWFVPAGVNHVTACVSATPCRFYFHAEGAFDFLPPTDGD